MYVGSQAKMVAVLGRFLPRFMDKLMELTMYRTQHSDRPSKSKVDSALYHPGYGLHERGTNKGWMRRNSYYVKMSKYPLASAAIAAFVGAALWAAVSAKQKD